MNAQDYTESQSAIINQIMNAGWKIKTMSMVGRQVWIVAELDRSNIFLDEQLMGTIGVKGKLSLEYQQFNYREKVTEAYQLSNRLKKG